MSSAPTPPEPEAQPLITVRAAVVLLTAAVIGLVLGGLSFYSGATPTVAGAVLAGLTAAGVSVPVLHKLIG